MNLSTIGSSNRWKSASVIAIGAGAALALGACSSGSSSSPTTSAPAPTTAAPTSAAPAPGNIPAAPAGSKQLSSNGSYSRYSTSQAPAAVVSYYSGAFKADGYTVTSQNAGGGGWGQYGGSGAGLSANNGTTFAAVNAGGSKQGATYFEVCSGTSAAAVSSCQQNSHANTGGS